MNINSINGADGIESDEIDGRPHRLYKINGHWEAHCKCKEWWYIDLNKWEEDTKRKMACPFCFRVELVVRCGE